MAAWLHRIARAAATLLIAIAIFNLLVGVFLRYFVGAVTDFLDLDPVPYVWVEEVGEMALAWLTLLAAAIGIRQRSHFTLHVWVHQWSPRAQRAIEVVHHLLIAGFGAVVAWYGWRLSQLNASLTSPGLQINMAWLYASSLVGGVLIVVYALSMVWRPAPDAGEGHGS